LKRVDSFPAIQWPDAKSGERSQRERIYFAQGLGFSIAPGSILIFDSQG
jgi:hypothetical protein